MILDVWCKRVHVLCTIPSNFGLIPLSKEGVHTETHLLKRARTTILSMYSLDRVFLNDVIHEIQSIAIAQGSNSYCRLRALMVRYITYFHICVLF